MQFKSQFLSYAWFTTFKDSSNSNSIRYLKLCCLCSSLHCIRRGEPERDFEEVWRASGQAPGDELWTGKSWIVYRKVWCWKTYLSSVSEFTRLALHLHWSKSSSRRSLSSCDYTMHLMESSTCKHATRNTSWRCLHSVKALNVEVLCSWETSYTATMEGNVRR